MVLDYAEGGNLYNWISKHYKKLDWSYKLNALYHIISGFKEIHEKQMVHQDFHTGNILLLSTSLDKNAPLVISDMGLCGKADDIDKSNIYGVMPYVAPEVLRGYPYTQAADIYSFGMVMYFVATGRQPFANRAHDEILVLDVCEGIRPNINDQEAPKCYIDLMKRCWDSNSDNRPETTEIFDLVKSFYDTYVPDVPESELFKWEEWEEQEDYEEDDDIKEQFKEADEYKESNFLTLEERRQSETHPQAVYTSRLLNPYTRDLSKYDFDTECLECEI
jgi:serine/threonine protein kinase